MHLFNTVVLVLVIHNVKDSRQMPITESTMDEGMNYLTRYGYMSSGGDMTEAIRRMQAFSGLAITGELDSETMDKMRKKRCGMSDMEGTGQRVRRYALFGTKWSQNDLTYEFTSFPGGNELTQAETRSAVEAAFKLWADVTPLTFTETDSFPVVIDIQFVTGDHGDGDPFDGSGGVLAHAFFPGFAIGGDAHFDEEESWVSALEIDSASGDEIDLYQVAAHEFGHSLGLSHSEDPDALMAPFYRGFIKDLQLGQDDILGIQALYGINPNMPTAANMPELTANPDQPAVGSTQPGAAPSVAACPSPTTYNAASVIRGETFIFEADSFWRLATLGQVDTTLYPATTNSFFPGLPSGSIDATFERVTEGFIVFIIGSEYWYYDGTSQLDGYPRPLTDLGLPADTTIDAAFSWKGNGDTYLFSGDQYWRYDEMLESIYFDSPKKIADNWNGIPDDLDATLQDADDNVYFIKDQEVFYFNMTSMEVITGYPKLAAVEFFGCPDVDEADEDDSSAASHTSPTLLTILLTTLIHLALHLSS